MAGNLWVVDQGEAERIESVAAWLEGREWYRAHVGRDWIVLEARDADDARAQAALYDARRHPAQAELELGAELIRAGVESV
jgi:hypothetical protein